MASHYTNEENQHEEDEPRGLIGNTLRRSLGNSALFGRRSSRSSPPAAIRPASEIQLDDKRQKTIRIRIVPSIENPSRSLIFSIIERDLEVGRMIKIGRFTDRSSIQNHISFKSKVVSRSHCEIWQSHHGKVFLKDTKSSSGTFVNHVRLSPANTESRPVEIHDGDLVQLGVDYQGGYEEVYRAVKMRFEVNRTKQERPLSYSVSAYKHLRNLTNDHVTDVEECCICLYALAPFQALFVAPCAHSYHFKCIKPLFESYPGFQCPICRTYSDLDASVAIEAEEVVEKFGLRTSSTATTLSFVDSKQRTHEASSVLPHAPLSSVSSSPATPVAEPSLSASLVGCSASLSGLVSSVGIEGQ
ncbi:E3 ubiquitin-protein ligase DMA2 [Choanephora cucurbitarum]|uniref:E3 ubiquitin-protein ligase DMA2 n=1 Tax=Choanephora cucurbitarum TaxID=101091 RepID=A0A1C7N7T4_9FUNG|nr:E3 ubiquitin-protein ligase DMA2 [Choanephora cucurbitarum]